MGVTQGRWLPKPRLSGGAPGLPFVDPAHDEHRIGARFEGGPVLAKVGVAFADLALGSLIRLRLIGLAADYRSCVRA